MHMESMYSQVNEMICYQLDEKMINIYNYENMFVEVLQCIKTFWNFLSSFHFQNTCLILDNNFINTM